MIPEIDTVNIEAVTPAISCGRFPIKRVVGDLLTVEADIFTHGHDVVRAVAQWRKLGENTWREVVMTHKVNDRWRGSFRLEENTTYEYTVLAWRDPFLSWAHDTKKKHEARQDLTSDLLEGRKIVEAAIARADLADAARISEKLLCFEERLETASSAERALELLKTVSEAAARQEPVMDLLADISMLLRGLAAGQKLGQGGDPITDVVLGNELRLLMAKYPDRSDCGRYHQILEVTVDRKRAEFASWYEMWGRSQGTDPTRSATFAEMEQRLDEIAALGFDVVYLPPIHPIGFTNRKGPNNSLICPPGSPGCPYAIGNQFGGHTAVEPSLGTLDDFRTFERACRSRGMEIALDIALQTSPDHPWVKEHPEWFKKRPDGTIKFAENPPKKYEDIYPLDFTTTDREGLWNGVLDVFRFWMAQGVRIFRVDNPHTKPVEFWKWLIAEIRKSDPDVMFLAEAFTRAKMMQILAKSGYTQSYTYFTWRNFKHEIIDYFTELTQTDVAEYFRGNLFVNTPDILPEFLQNAPRSAFKIRALLATTLAPTWGMYNGFELCEGAPLHGKEEYIDSEKYDFKVWDWNRPGNIKEYISRLNGIRREHPALQENRNLRFYQVDNEHVLFYGKHLEEERDHVFVIVNLNPFEAQEAAVHFPIHELGIRPDETYQLHDLITGRRYYWKGEVNFVKLDPGNESGHLFHLLRWSHREQDFDYFL
jgi:starch synthase (maltosyl-transferring)